MKYWFQGWYAAKWFVSINQTSKPSIFTFINVYAMIGVKFKVFEDCEYRMFWNGTFADGNNNKVGTPV